MSLDSDLVKYIINSRPKWYFIKSKSKEMQEVEGYIKITSEPQE